MLLLKDIKQDASKNEPSVAKARLCRSQIWLQKICLDKYRGFLMKELLLELYPISEHLHILTIENLNTSWTLSDSGILR